MVRYKWKNNHNRIDSLITEITKKKGKTQENIDDLNLMVLPF